MKKNNYLLTNCKFWFILCAIFMSVSLSAKVRLWTIGDSTVQIWESPYFPKAGWGQVLQYFFDANEVEVIDKAVGGTTTKSFYENHWITPVKENLVVGDFVFIQFGINDMYSLKDVDLFKQYLTLFVEEIQAKGAYPVLVSTLCGNENTWGEYPVATGELASELGVPFIDLSQMSQEYLATVGKEYATNFIYMNLQPGDYPNYPTGSIDNTHIQEIGAIDMARFVVEGVRALADDTHVAQLIPALKPTYKVTFSSNIESAGIISRTAYFPAGISVTAKAMPNQGYKFVGWSGDLTDNQAICRFTMPSNDMNIVANFDEGAVSIWYEKIVNGDFSQWTTCVAPTSKTGDLLYPVGWSFQPTPDGSDAGGLTKWGDVIFARPFGANMVEISGRATPYQQDLYQTVYLEQGEAALSTYFKGGEFEAGNPSVIVYLKKEGETDYLHQFSVSDLTGYNATDFMPHTATVPIPESGAYQVGIHVENVNSECWIQMTNFSLRQASSISSAIDTESMENLPVVRVDDNKIYIDSMSESGEIKSVSLFSINGTVISLHESDGEKFLTLDKPLQKGVFVLQIRTSTGIFTQKILL